jgi:hypothetical protein
VIAMVVAALLLQGPGDIPPAPVLRFSQMIVQQQITVRVRGRNPDREPPPQIKWKEGKGPKCIPAGSIAGAALIGPSSVDIILRDNRRLRIRLERSCPALDFYRGFYIRPNPDGRICADRDAIRSRMGGQCEIDAFRMLKPSRRD